MLAGPRKTTVGRMENYAIRADGPAVPVIVRKLNGADRVSLRQRVLPFPTAFATLRVRLRGHAGSS